MLSQPQSFARSTSFLIKILVFGFAVFFASAGYHNMFPSQEVISDYDKWGYPGGFNRVTAIMEWTVAVTLLIQASRKLGAVLGFGILSAAAITLLSNGAVGHAMLPLTLMAAMAVVVFISCRERSGSKI